MFVYREHLAYVASGIIGTVICYFIYYALVTLGMYYVYSNAISWVFGIVLSYYMHKRWVFYSQAQGFSQIFSEMVKFVSSRLVSMTFDMLLLIFLVGFLMMNDLLAKIITGIMILIVNFLLSKFFVFGKNKEKK